MTMKKTSIIFLLFIFSFFSNSRAQVNTEIFRIATDSLGFSVHSGLDFTLMMGNSDFQYMGTDTRLNYNWGEHYTFLVTNGGYGKNNGKSFFSQALIHFRNVNSLSKYIQLEEFVQYDNNKKRLLLRRVLAGGGLRFRALNREKAIARIGVSFFLEDEKYDLEVNANHAIDDMSIRSSTYLTFIVNLTNDVKFLSTTYLQPDISEIKDVRLLSDSALNVKLGKNIGMQTKLNVRYDTRPADGIKKFDLISKLGFVLNFD